MSSFVQLYKGATLQYINIDEIFKVSIESHKPDDSYALVVLKNGEEIDVVDYEDIRSLAQALAAPEPGGEDAG